MGDKMVEPGLEPIVSDCDLNYEAEYEQLKLDNDTLMEQVEMLSEEVAGMEKRIARLSGEIDGLRFAVRCNGVSGGEVK